jgi:phosphatidylglycerophosphate synthase
MPMMTSVPGPIAFVRRPLATRNTSWARAFARWLAARRVRPNSVSVASVGFALISATAFVLSAHVANEAQAALLLLAAACVQVRLLCNLLDGMLAVEEGLKSRTGDIFNELPDRIADVLILVGAGYAVPALAYGPPLGWAAAVTAMLTAYVRALAGSLGFTQRFIGPMAKPHRMFTLTVAALLASAEALLHLPARAIPTGLAVIVAGAIVTSIRRTRRLLLEAEPR